MSDTWDILEGREIGLLTGVEAVAIGGEVAEAEELGNADEGEVDEGTFWNRTKYAPMTTHSAMNTQIPVWRRVFRVCFGLSLKGW